MNHEDRLVNEITSAMVQIESGMNSKPEKIRMHPLDIAYLRRRYFDRHDVTTIDKSRIVGVRIEPDCAVTRGWPQVDW